jgi:hypothetical protein
MFKFQSLASALYFLAASVSATRNGGSKADEPGPHDRVVPSMPGQRLQRFYRGKYRCLGPEIGRFRIPVHGD